MGFRTVAVFNNDVLHEAKDDIEFGSKLFLGSAGFNYPAIHKSSLIGKYGEIISVAHSDMIEVIAIKNGRGVNVSENKNDSFLIEKNYWDQGNVVEIMKDFLERNGFKVIKKRK